MGNTLLGLARHFGQQKMEDKLLELGATVYVCDLPPIIPLRPSSAESFRSEASSVSMSPGSSEMKGDSPQGEASSLNVPLRKSEQRALCFKAGLEKLSKKLDASPSSDVQGLVR